MIVGLDEDKIAAFRDQLAQEVYDSCKPKIIPDIKVISIQSKTILMMELPAGSDKPYYVPADAHKQEAVKEMAGIMNRPAAMYRFRATACGGDVCHRVNDALALI